MVVGPLPPGPFDAVVVAYLQVIADERRCALRATAEVVVPGGFLFVVGHDTASLAEGVGGPQDPAVLFTPQDVVADLAEEPGLVVVKAERVRRPVVTPDGERTAIDALVRVRRIEQPTSESPTDPRARLTRRRAEVTCGTGRPSARRVSAAWAKTSWASMPFQVAADVPGDQNYDPGEPVVVLAYLAAAVLLVRARSGATRDQGDAGCEKPARSGACRVGAAAARQGSGCRVRC